MFTNAAIANLPGIKEANLIFCELGLQYTLVEMRCTKPGALGLVKTKDLISLNGIGIVVAPLWVGENLEINQGHTTTEACYMSSGDIKVLENFHEWQTRLELILEAIPNAIERLTEYK